MRNLIKIQLRSLSLVCIMWFTYTSFVFNLIRNSFFKKKNQDMCSVGVSVNKFHIAHV